MFGESQPFQLAHLLRYTTPATIWFFSLTVRPFFSQVKKPVDTILVEISRTRWKNARHCSNTKYLHTIHLPSNMVGPKLMCSPNKCGKLKLIRNPLKLDMPCHPDGHWHVWHLKIHLPRKLTARPSKMMVGKRSFPFEMVPF